MRCVLAGLLLFTLMAVASPDAQAQTLDDEFSRAVSMNPLGLMFGLFSGEAEMALSQNTSAGIAASFHSVSSTNNYISAEGKYRYYPQGEALRGFSIGGAGGITTVTQSCPTGLTGSWCETDTFFGFTVGINLDYQWFMGDDERFVVVGGIGAKRLFVSGDLYDAMLGYPTLRLGIGYTL